MKKLLVVLIGTFLFASEGGETDIVARVINFLIFVAILWYLIADKVSKYHKIATKITKLITLATISVSPPPLANKKVPIKIKSNFFMLHSLICF